MSESLSILVTGGAGFIGSHVCDRLVGEGHRVVCADDLSLGRRASIAHLEGRPGFRFVELDVAGEADALRALFDMNRFDTVWHLAANSDIRRGSADREIDLDRTFLSTFRVLEECAAHGTAEVLFASSSAVFGETGGSGGTGGGGETGDPLGEDDGPLRPISFYGAAKLAGEAYVSAYASRAGMKAWVFRFPNVVGPRATHGVILDFVRRVGTTGRLDVLGNGTQRKPYLHVSDLVDGMWAAWLGSSSALNVFHLAGRGSTTVARIAEWVADALGLPRRSIRFGDGDRGWPGDVPRFAYDCRRIEALGWAPRLDSDAAVRRAIDEIVRETAAETATGAAVRTGAERT